MTACMPRLERVGACVDCRHKIFTYGALCCAPAVVVFDPVTGMTPRECRDARKDKKSCGPRGKYFEPKVLTPPSERPLLSRIFG